MYGKIVYNTLYYMQYVYNYLEKQKMDFLGPQNVVSIHVYDFDDIRKTAVYQQSIIRILWALFYKCFLKNEQKFKSCLLWKDPTDVDPLTYDVQATQMLEMKFADHSVCYVRNNKVHHVPQNKQRSLQHCALVSIADQINTSLITFLLNQVYPLELTVKEFISLVYLKKMASKDILIQSLLQKGLLLKTIIMKDFDIKEREYKDDQVILYTT